MPFINVLWLFCKIVQIMWKVRSRDLIFLPPLSITGRHFYAPRPHPLRPFPCRSKRDTNCVALPASPVSRAGRYNTLHLAKQGSCAKGDPVSPFLESPGFCRCVGLKIAFLHTIPPSPLKPKETVQTCPYGLACYVSLFGPAGQNEQADIKITLPG